MATVKKTRLPDTALVQHARSIGDARIGAETARDNLVQKEIDKAFRQYGPVLAGIELVSSAFRRPQKKENTSRRISTLQT